MTANTKKAAKPGKRALIVAFSALVLAAVSFFAYTAVYYRADEAALSTLVSDDTVTVSQTDYGYLFDGPSETDALIFYPGGKVEETSYAPLLRAIAEGGSDVCLVKMPFRLAIFGGEKAEDVITQTDYARYLIGGHSLGGVIASSYASNHSGEISGVLLLASYPTKDIPADIPVLSLRGSEDGVLNLSFYERGIKRIHGSFTEVIIYGGNHAQFGSYGAQRGDGEPEISPEEQWEQTAKSFANGL